nr:MAG TPA: hypothetical protein [Caudoviricetes sp.]
MTGSQLKLPDCALTEVEMHALSYIRRPGGQQKPWDTEGCSHIHWRRKPELA